MLGQQLLTQGRSECTSQGLAFVGKTAASSHCALSPEIYYSKTSIRKGFGAAGIATGCLITAFALQPLSALRPPKVRHHRTARKDGAEARVTMPLVKEAEVPKDLYQLLRVKPDADVRQIKQSYYALQKICHPDVAGPEGAEMCILLNDAYNTLSDPKAREEYNKQIGAMDGSIRKVEPIATDLEPTWSWKPKSHKKEPLWDGRPRSRSLYHKLEPEERGEKWIAQEFVYVDEWSCIACRNCCDIAPRTFCLDAQQGRARVYAQWGNSEEYLDYAVASCPVDCISWVSREELQVLEHVTAAEMFDNPVLPCPMAIQQGVWIHPVFDPWKKAEEFTESAKKREEAANKALDGLRVAADQFKHRIHKVYLLMSESMRQAGWS